MRRRRFEHKAVAFDVLQQVDPRYWVRVAGLAVAVSQLLGWWMVATAMLMAQEDFSREEREKWKAEAERIHVAHEGRARADLFKRAILDYLRRDFHPDDRDDYALAREYLESIGAAA